VFGRKSRGGSLGASERSKLAFFFDTAVEEIDALSAFYREKAESIASGDGRKEEDNFPNARTTVTALSKCRTRVLSMKEGVVSGRYDLASYEEQMTIIVEYLGLCDKEGRVNGDEGIVGAGVAWGVLSVAREKA